MKVAPIARTLLLTVMGWALLIAAPVAAAEGVTPLRGSTAYGYEASQDGTDVFWMKQSKTTPAPKFGYSHTTSLMRTSLLDGSRALIKKFDPEDLSAGFPERILAGGGFVFVNTIGDGPDRDQIESSSTVLRMARDGSGVQKVAEGQLNAGEEDSVVIENGKGRLNDCGTAVAAELVTDDGSVVIRETTSDRNSKSCGRKKMYDHVRFYLLSPAGIKREIHTDHIRVRAKVHVQSDGSWWSDGSEESGPDDVDYARIVSVVGDRALYARAGSPSFWVRDLNTGAEAGPYNTAITSRDQFNGGSLDPMGRVAMSSYSQTGSRKHRRTRQSAGVFQPAAGTAPFAPVKGRAFLIFCGNRLIALTSRGVRELDPVTLNLIRPIAPARKDGLAVWSENACSDDYLYMSDRRGKNARFLAYPLGS